MYNYTHTHTCSTVLQTDLQPVALDFDQAVYNVGEESAPVSVCVQVIEGQLDEQIQVTLTSSDLEALGECKLLQWCRCCRLEPL